MDKDREDADEFKAGPDWAGKMAFAPGVPVDAEAIPKRYYQVLFGKVYTLMTWSDGSTVRGEADLASLAAVAGKAITKEGWYDALGRYIGSELPGSL